MVRRAALWSRKRFFRALGAVVPAPRQHRILVRSTLMHPNSTRDEREADLSPAQRALRVDEHTNAPAHESAWLGRTMVSDLRAVEASAQGRQFPGG